MVNPVYQQDEELLLNPFGSRYLASGTYTDVNSNEFVVQEDTVISVLTGGDVSISENSIDYKASMNLSGVTLKKGALIVAPVGEAFKSITIDSGSIMAYNCVVGGTKPSGSVPLLLDLYPDAAAAYSLRKLRNDYTGDAIKVRIDTTGQPTYEIGFDSNGELDTASLLSFAGSNDAFVHTWYDQSGGGGNNATQESAAYQSKIVNAGSVIVNPTNNLPSILSGGTQIFMNIPSTPTKNMFVVHELQAFSLVNYIAFQGASTGGMFLGGSLSSIHGFGVVGGGAVKSDTGEDLNLNLANFYHNGTGYLVSKNNGALTDINSTNAQFSIDQILGRDIAGPLSCLAYNQEIIIYSSGDDSNNEAIKSNINSHYNIY